MPDGLQYHAKPGRHNFFIVQYFSEHGTLWEALNILF